MQSNHVSNTQERDGLLFWAVFHPHHDERRQLLLLACNKEQVLESLHEKMGHQEVERTLNLLCPDVSWWSCLVRLRSGLKGINAIS